MPTNLPLPLRSSFAKCGSHSTVLVLAALLSTSASAQQLPDRPADPNRIPAWSNAKPDSEHDFKLIALPEVLAVGTRNGAVALKRDHEIGTLKVGKKADLILTDQDPFAAVANVGFVSTVNAGGLLYHSDAKS